MIPKIAWFHWDSATEMSWLRKRGIETFKEQNPSWDIRVIDTPKEIAERELYRIQKTGDWAIWRMLRKHGGFLIHSDAIYLNPIPDEWLGHDICAQLYRRGYVAPWKRMIVDDVHQIPAFGIVPNHQFMIDVDNECENRRDNEFQNLGIQMLRTVTERKPIREYTSSIHNIHKDEFCFFGWGNVGPLWERLKDDRTWDEGNYPRYAIGIHWYGGNEQSKLLEYDAKCYGFTLIETIASRSFTPGGAGC